MNIRQKINEITKSYIDVNLNVDTHRLTEDMEKCFNKETQSLKDQLFKVTHFTPIDKELPLVYESGDWDGLRSESVIVMNNRDECCVGRLYSGVMDGSEFQNWYTEDEYEIQGNVIGWCEIPKQIYYYETNLDFYSH